MKATVRELVEEFVEEGADVRKGWSDAASTAKACSSMMRQIIKARQYHFSADVMDEFAILSSELNPGLTKQAVKAGVACPPDVLSLLKQFETELQQEYDAVSKSRDKATDLYKMSRQISDKLNKLGNLIPQ